MILVPVLQFFVTSMLPLLMKDHLVLAFVALVVIFYLVADLCLSQADSVNSANVDSSSGCSHTSTAQLHGNKTMSLMVSNSTLCNNT